MTKAQTGAEAYATCITGGVRNSAANIEKHEARMPVPGYGASEAKR